MALSSYTGDPEVISKLATYARDRGLTGPETQAKFDEGLKTFVEWFNGTHLADILANMPNRNLLHNWDFRNPVNQRGLSSYAVSSNSVAVFTIDRWRLTSNDNGQESMLTVGDGFITLASTNSRPVLRQFTDITTKEESVFTFSVSIPAITGAASIYLRDTAYTTYAIKSNISSPGLYAITGTVPAGKTLMVQIHTNANGQSFSMNKAKLELGSVSTLANDPPADYGEELAKCQRFALKLPASSYRAAEYTSNTITFYIPTPATLRTNPAFSADPTVKTLSGTAQIGFSFAYTALPNCIKVVATKTSHGLTDATLALAEGIASADL